MKIITTQKGECAEYCAQELKKYIIAMSCGNIMPEIQFVDNLPKKIENAIILALLEELNLDQSDLKDPFIEDILDIDVKNLSGYIAGSNARSILMGVYKYCYSAGCRYTRPGEGGDYIPKADLLNHSFKYRKKADQPFRGECCEGSISYEHMRDTVYWLPKIGMNMYMIEGLVPYTYMHKWYGHVWNDKYRIPGQATDYYMLEKYIDRLERDIQKTGIQLHTLGHAWMFEGWGIHHEPPKIEQAKFAKLSKEQQDYLALVNGKRGIYGNSTFYTHFCYSNPDARKFLINYMVEYAKNKPHVDFIHAWLADATNNQCECEECVKMHPSDWYVLLLNELDEALTKEGLDTRVVFIMYVDTVRPPEKLRLKNPNRFVLLSAIGLHYEKGYINEEYTGEIPPFVRNDFHPEPNALRLKWHKEWKEMHGNMPSMIFEYRYYTDMYNDLSQMQICRETHRDMKALESVSFNGCMSDQTHRMYMPTALPLIMMGATLFDKNADYDTVANEYFEGAFGKDGILCREYLEKLSTLLCPSNTRIGGGSGVEEDGLGSIEASKKCWINNEYVAERAAKIPAFVDEFLPIIKRNVSEADDEARRTAWNYLTYHAEMCKLYSYVLLAGAENDMDKAREKFKDLKKYLEEREMEYHNVFDFFLFTRFLSLKLDIKVPSYFE